MRLFSARHIHAENMHFSMRKLVVRNVDKLKTCVVLVFLLISFSLIVKACDKLLIHSVLSLHIDDLALFLEEAAQTKRAGLGVGGDRLSRGGCPTYQVREIYYFYWWPLNSWMSTSGDARGGTAPPRGFSLHIGVKACDKLLIHSVLSLHIDDLALFLEEAAQTKRA